MRIPTFRRGKVGIAVLAGVALVAAPMAAAPASANTAGTGLVISEIYAGGSGPAYTNDFVEIYNPTASNITATGLSVQYRSSANSAAIVGSQVFPLTGSVPAGGHFLLTGGTTGGGAALPAADSTSAINMSGTAGQVYLVSSTTGLAATTPGNQVGVAQIIDMIGYGTAAVNFEGTKAAAPTSAATNSLLRSVLGTDTDVNSADFASGTPTPTASGITTDPEPEPPVDKTIQQIQGPGAASPLDGVNITTTGVVTASYPTGGFNGFYLQSTGTGGAIDFETHTTSDAVFVYTGSIATLPSIGDAVEVTGIVDEFNELTEINVTDAANITTLTAQAAPQPVTTAIPLTSVGRESVEGMLVAPTGDFTVTDNYDTNYYAEIRLNPGSVPLIGATEAAEPGPAAVAYAAANLARIITLDDGASINFNTNKNIELPYLSTTAPVRIGAAVTFTKPVILDYRNSLWKFQPTSQLTTLNAATVQPATFENTRTAAPEPVGGDVKIASFNVLNYFTTTGDELTGCSYYTDRVGDPVTVNTGCDARGAAEQEDLDRQQQKIVAAINALDADVVSLEEIENSAVFGIDRDTALSDLVAALNTATGATTWAFVPSPAALPADEDVIRTAFIYKPSAIETVGTSSILDVAAFSNARQPLAQEFKRAGHTTATAFLVIANHFKSKGSAGPLPGDTDQGDGQGNSNASRVAQANALVSFANTLKTEKSIDKVFLSGDFNAYLKEDPIDVLTAAGYTDLGSSETNEYTYSFDSAVGSLDHIFASPSAVAAVAGVDIWNINSVESIALEYSRYNYNALDLYASGPYRSSDHDPMIVGVKLADVPVELTFTAGTPTITGAITVGSTLTAQPGTFTPSPDAFAYQWKRNGVDIAGATGAGYVLVAADAGATITVAVTATKTGYTPLTKLSTATSAITVNVFVTTPVPTISGKPEGGSKLTVNEATWSPTPTSFTYQWLNNGKPISGATSASYTVKASDRGDRLSVAVTGVLANTAPTTETSASVTILKILTKTPKPKIIGTTKVGKTLTVKAGTWGPARVTLKYQWYRDGKAIKGADEKKYKLVKADRGDKITVKVTGSKTGYETESQTRTTPKIK